MNRELKFRIWSKRSNSFLRIAQEGYEYHPWVCLSVDGKVMHNDNMGAYAESNQKDYIIHQYTGTADKSGKEIYEGDVLVFDKDGHREYGYTVVFSNGKFELKMPDCKMNIDIGYHREMLIVGNIFNPLFDEEKKKKK
jgi:uncharacterized phage protein (TIGR01671 family)